MIKRLYFHIVSQSKTEFNVIFSSQLEAEKVYDAIKQNFPDSRGINLVNNIGIYIQVFNDDGVRFWKDVIADCIFKFDSEDRPFFVVSNGGTLIPNGLQSRKKTLL